MKMTQTIGFLGGGMMAEALIKGMLQGSLLDADQLTVVDPLARRRDFLADTYQVRVADDYSAVAGCDIVILAVKPQVMAQMLDECSSQFTNALFISIAAGIPLAMLEEKLGENCRVIRVMPNTPALVLEGASVLSPGHQVNQEDLDIAKALFDVIGQAMILPESYLDAVTGLSGSGPAYVFSFLEAMIDGGLKVGLPRPEAERLAQQTILGSVKLAMAGSQHPAQLKAMVTSPGGTTIAGLHALERAGFRAAVMDAIEAATERSRQLGK